MRNILFGFALSALSPLLLSAAFAQVPAQAPAQGQAQLQVKSEALPPAQQEEDHRACLAKGLVQGTEAYSRCRVQMSDARIRENQARVRNLIDYATQKAGGNFHDPAYGPGAIFDTGANAMGYASAYGIPGPLFHPFTDSEMLAKVMRPQKSTVETVCAITGSGADEQKICNSVTTVETLPEARPAPLSDAMLSWMRACMLPVKPNDFAAIATACSNLLGDKSANLMGPDIAALYTSRGNAYDDLHDAAHARGDYDASLAANPDNGLSYYNRGLFLMRQKDIEAANADFTKAVALNDAIAPAHLYLGQLAYDKGDYETALRQFDASIQLDPRNATVHMRRGVTLLKLGQSDKAMADLKLAATLDPALAKKIFTDGKAPN